MDIHAPSVYVRHTQTPKGRGAFAVRAFAAGETIERCPVVLFNAAFSAVPQELRTLLFNWGVLAGGPAMHCLPLGYGGMYNHDNPANMRYEADAQGGVLHFVAIRDIAADEELTVNYNAHGGGHESDEDSWFRTLGVTPYAPG